MSGMHHHQWAGRQQQAPPRKRRIVTYCMQPLGAQAGYSGPRQDGHRFGVNRILRLPGIEGGSGDGLVSAGRDGVVRLWDVSSMLSRAGKMGSKGTSSDDEVRCLGIFASHTDWVTGLAVAADRILASSSNDGTLKLWDLAAAREEFRVQLKYSSERGIGAMNVDGEGTVSGEGGRDIQLAGGLANGADGLKSGLGNGGINETIKTARREPSQAPPPRPSPLATVAGHGDYVKCLTYAPEGGVLISGGLDKRILLWDLQRMTAPLMSLYIEQEDGSARLPAGSMDNDGYIRGYSEVAAWRYLRDPSRVFLRPGVAAAGPNEVLELCRQNKGSVYCVDTSTDGALVASGGTDRMIRLLDPRAGGGLAAKVCKLDGHRDNVRCVRIDEGGTRVVSGSTDGTIRVWDVRQQHCLGVYELPGGSVWAMQPSPCDFDVYYSGGRGRRVYRTDFRTGESNLVCMTNAEVLDMALELGRGNSHDGSIFGQSESRPLSMWLSSTEPDITLWGGSSGGGDALRTGLPQPRRAPREGAATAPYDDVPTSKSDADAEGRATPADEGECLLSGPVGTISGHPGVVRHVVLNNRRHVLTEDNADPPNVALWDVTKAKQVEVYPPGTILEERERALTEIIAVRPWFTVDTHLGTPLVSLSESSAFDGELYAVDASGDRQTLLEPPPQPLASQASPAAAKLGDAGAMRATKARSVQDEVKVNLGEAVLRGLFGRWIEQQLRLDDSRGGRSRRGLGGSSGNGGYHHGGVHASGGRHLDNGNSYSSGESDDEDSEQGSGDESSSVSRASRTSSDGSGSAVGGGHGSETALRYAGSGNLRGSHGLDVDLSGRGVGRGTGRALGDDVVLWVTETDLGGNGGGVQRTLLQKRVGEFDGREGEDVIPHWVTACVLHGEFHAKEQPKVAFYLAPWMPPESQNTATLSSTGRGAPPQGASGKRGSTGSGGSGSGGGDGNSNARGGGGGKEGTAAAASRANNPASQRFTAPAQLLISKVMAYVLAHAELRQHLESTGPMENAADEGSHEAEGTRTPPLAPEDVVEVLCGDRVMEPHLYVGAIQQYLWNPSADGTLFLRFRSRSRPPGAGSRLQEGF